MSAGVEAPASWRGVRRARERRATLACGPCPRADWARCLGHAGWRTAAHIASQADHTPSTKTLWATGHSLSGVGLLHRRSSHRVDVGLLVLIAVGGFVVIADVATAGAEPAQQIKRTEPIRSGSIAVGTGKPVRHTYTLPVPWQATQLTVSVVPLLPIS